MKIKRIYYIIILQESYDLQHEKTVQSPQKKSGARDKTIVITSKRKPIADQMMNDVFSDRESIKSGDVVDKVNFITVEKCLLTYILCMNYSCIVTFINFATFGFTFFWWFRLLTIHFTLYVDVYNL